MSDDEIDFKGTGTPESWLCVDCGMNTAPGLFNRQQFEEAAKALGDAWKNNEASVEQHINNQSEVYTVRERVWAEAGMQSFGGCLCIGCLEQRLGRVLRPKDFRRNHPFNQMPGTARLLKRRGKR
jgi:hypothetical protein